MHQTAKNKSLKTNIINNSSFSLFHHPIPTLKFLYLREGISKTPTPQISLHYRSPQSCPYSWFKYQIPLWFPHILFNFNNVSLNDSDTENKSSR